MITGALLFCSAVLFYFSFPNVLSVKGAPLCAWGCALPFLYILEGKRWCDRVLLGLAWGFVSHALLVSWLIPVSPGGWFLFAGVLSVQGVVFALFYPSSSAADTQKLFLIPSAWVASEWLRTILLGGFAWGLGYSQAPFPEVIQVASIGGVYAVSWMLVFASTLIFLVIRTRARKGRLWFWASGLLILLILGGSLRILAAPKPPLVGDRMQKGLRVGVIQPNIRREEKTLEALYDAHAVRHMTLTQKAVVAGSLGKEDLVVWPETSFTDDILTDTVWRPRLEAAARGLGVNMVVGSALLREGHDLNSAVLLSSEGDWKSVYHKMRLVPFSEFTPKGASALAGWLHIGSHHFTAGVRPGNMVLSGGRKFGVVICSEEFYPEMFRHLAAAKPLFAAVMLNDGWFTRREALYLHALAAPLRAVESGLPVVRSANTGLTCAFDAYGRRLGSSLEKDRRAVMVYDMPLAAAGTLYARYADVFALMCLVFVIMISIFIHVQRSKT